MHAKLLPNTWNNVRMAWMPVSTALLFWLTDATASADSVKGWVPQVTRRPVLNQPAGPTAHEVEVKSQLSVDPLGFPSRKKGRGLNNTICKKTTSALDTEISGRGSLLPAENFCTVMFRRIGEMVVSFCKNFSSCEIYVIKPILNALALEKENQWDDCGNFLK